MKAEGIESEAQQAQLQRLNCPYGQGYGFAEPLTAQDVHALPERGMVSAPGVTAGRLLRGLGPVSE